MAINTLATLKTALGNWLERSDISQRAEEFIALATSTLNLVIRDTRMVSHDSVTIASGTRYGTVPATMLEPIFLTSSDADLPLDQVSIQQLIQLRRQMTQPGQPNFYAMVGRRVEVCPVPASEVTLELSHYKEIPALVNDGDTNWLLTYRPDVYLYTALLHASSYLKDDQKVALFQNMVAQQVQAAIQSQSTIQLDSKEAGPTMNAPRDVKAPG